MYQLPVAFISFKRNNGVVLIFATHYIGINVFKVIISTPKRLCTYDDVHIPQTFTK